MDKKLIKSPPGLRRVNRLPVYIVVGVILFALGVWGWAILQRKKQQEEALHAPHIEEKHVDATDVDQIISMRPNTTVVAAANSAPVATQPTEVQDQTKPPVPPPPGVGTSTGLAAAGAGAPAGTSKKTFEQAQQELLLQQRADAERKREELRDEQLSTIIAASSEVDIKGHAAAGGEGAPPSLLPSAPALARPGVAGGLGAGGQGEDPNRQTEKAVFFDREGRKGQELLDNTRTPVSTPYELRIGTVIPATLITGINSDLPGNVLAQVRANVYDTATGLHLLIPIGAKLYGRYDNQITYGQKRVQIAWSRLTFPDGSVISLGNMSGVDQAGYGGFEDQVDNHYFRIFGSSLVLAGISAGATISQPQSTTTASLTPAQTATAAVGQQFAQAGTALLQRNLGIAPTIDIRPGYIFNVMVNKDVVFSEPYPNPQAPRIETVRFNERVDTPLRPTGQRLQGQALKGWVVAGAVPGRAFLVAPGASSPSEVWVGVKDPLLGRITDIYEQPSDGNWVIQSDAGFIIGLTRAE